jgi:hypothetical protein
VVSFQREGGVSEVQLRYGDKPAMAQRPAGERERRSGVVFLTGDRYRDLSPVKRLRVRVVTPAGTAQDYEVDLSPLARVRARLTACR